MRGGFLYTMIFPGGGFCSIQVVSWGGGGEMVLDEIDTCNITCFPSMMGYFPVRLSRCHHVSQSP